MLLDEDPAALIASCAQNFNLHPDKSALGRVQTSLSTLSSARSLRLQSLQSQLQKLSRQHATLSSQHSLTVSGHNGAEHAAEILRLDTEKFRVAKAASEADIECERLMAELEGLRSTLAGIEEEGVEGGHGHVGWGGAAQAAQDDEVLLKLKVYRSLGIEVEQDEATGEYNKVILRNAQKGDARVVNIEHGKFPRSFYANYFWQNL
ncbi:kinetochore protein-like protein spc24 [Lineolata rhizophorae]|uniref:Kinetochore protein Spc24 n=1 Tax=Lineolata rhizophorae TaxID=578093 RepID=A0A6A6NWX6_9PEZI|nr:kinetochore protein-like protein spc24 [Lineolata rhizophorae]